MPKPEISSIVGCNGSLEKKLGCLLSSSRKEWANPKKQRKYCINIWNAFLHSTHT
jgi:hypothetical protein